MRSKTNPMNSIQSQGMEIEQPLTMTLIRREFELNNDEDLFDDFKCTLK